MTTSTIPILFSSLAFSVAAYSASPRWGQASAVIGDSLYVYGGKTDDFNAYSYTSAPTNNDLLYLNLSSSFEATSPPWQLIGGSSTSGATKGPSVAWHTLSAFNTTEALLFGGSPGPTDDPVLVTRADSAWTFNAADTLKPVWHQQVTSWADEPVRRIHHTAVTIDTGQIFLVGGELADGSEQPQTDHYIFDADTQSFKTLPTEGGPGDITGHGSVVLGNGTIVVFGGYRQSTDTLHPFSELWTLDTMLLTNMTWGNTTLSGDSFPRPRRAFATTVIDDDKVLIHGGSDATFQTTYSDGWILDLAANPPAWSQAQALSQIGPRRDHFAFNTGSYVLFGFGYGASGPATDGGEIVVYDPSSSEIVDSYTPPPSSHTATATVPGATQTGGGSHPTATANPGGSDGGSQGGDGEDGNGSGSGNGGGDAGGGDNGNGTGGNPADGGPGSNNKKTTAIAVGTALGVLGALVVVVVTIWYIRRRRYGGPEERRFALLNSGPDLDQDQDSPQSATSFGRHLPLAGGYGEKDKWTILRHAGIGGAFHALTAGRRSAGRRDMLADEDTRQFSDPFYHDNNGSSWSLVSFLSGRRQRSRRQTSGSAHSWHNGAPSWTTDKGDPFSDGAALIHDPELGLVGAAAAARPSGRRGASHTSSLSAYSYTDPFAAPYYDDRDARSNDHDDPLDLPPPTGSLRNTSNLHIDTLLPLSHNPHVLSPVTEASRLSIGDRTSGSVSTTSHEGGFSPFDSSSRVTSRTSYENRTPRPTSIIDPAPRPLARSDTWWSKFARTSFLDRRNSRRHSGFMEFRDPNPPPRLIAIEESTHSLSPESAERSPGSQVLRHGSSKSRKGSYGAHAKSSSSLRTADSDALERLASAMDVAQHVQNSSHRTRDSTGTEYSFDGGQGHDRQQARSILDDEVPMVMSPEAVVPSKHSPALKHTHSTSPPVSMESSAGRSRSSSVAQRIRDFERQASLSPESTPPPTNTRQREERPKSKVAYGLVPKASLFVANPDHRSRSSGDTSV
ncbi:hypothetical protein CYLTODRAFT_445636 [Cylindrobasidium torrendii FP15055 ss-10]|uniref:Galactose oxidase n=1 Tax=Cylindrobasidium torrendii FP15055 ss-10 TaxID=1314674 RepID=A0A0D7B323_9AGAR|nr:hypothetical protein CYLTODRAFT_445636 [Cylindrobasidium torrendii FP15055 ss-10]